MITKTATNDTVRAVYCDYRSSDEDVYQALKRACDPLDRTWQRLSKARRIGIKFNQDWLREAVVMHQGQRQQLVSDSVARATLRLLKERTNAELFAVDIGLEGVRAHVTDGSSTQLLPVFREFNLPFIEGRRRKPFGPTCRAVGLCSIAIRSRGPWWKPMKSSRCRS